MQSARFLPFFALFSFLCGCFCGCNGDRTEGLITTHDGRLVSGTADVITSELGYKWANRAADAAGAKWKATLSIAGEPDFELVHESEWGWKHMHMTLTLAPPSDAPVDSAARMAIAERAESAVRAVAVFRVRHPDDITCSTTILEATQALPGSQKYTVVAGDTWTGIANAFYGNTQNWRLIADANSATELTPGIAITIPPKP